MFKLIFKILGFIFLFCPLNTLALEICANKNNKIGIAFKPTPKGGWELLSTSKVNINSNLQEDVLKALFEAEANSRVEIFRFTESKVKMDEGSLLKKLKSMVTTSRCYVPYSFVEVSVKVSSETVKIEEYIFWC